MDQTTIIQVAAAVRKQHIAQRETARARVCVALHASVDAFLKHNYGGVPIETLMRYERADGQVLIDEMTPDDVLAREFLSPHR